MLSHLLAETRIITDIPSQEGVVSREVLRSVKTLFFVSRGE